MKRFKDFIEYLINNQIQFSVTDYIDPDHFNVNVPGNHWFIDITPSTDCTKVNIIEKTFDNQENRLPEIDVEIFLLFMDRTKDKGFDIPISKLMEDKISKMELVKIIESLSEKNEPFEIRGKGESISIKIGGMPTQPFQFKLG